MRLHPAQSRIERLAKESPAQAMLFDCLMDEQGNVLLDRPLSERRAALERLYAREKADALLLSPATLDPSAAQRWLDASGGALDGVVAKLSQAPYLPGERAMIKVKTMRTADCVVGGFRYATGKREVGSLLLGLYDDAGLLHHVGFTSAIAADTRAALTEELEVLVEAPGFTGDAPGGPSRWSTDRSAEWQPLRSELVVEIRYDHVTAGRFRHGTKLLRWRPDKAPRQCGMDQLDRPLGARAVASLTGHA
jgi:ATP-dependent DNA ligase